MATPSEYNNMNIVRKVYYVLFDLVQTLVIAGAIFVVIYALLFRPYQVHGLSMYPNFDNGEYVLTDLISKRFNSLQKGDIVVFHSPTETDKEFIKRIIGEPGDTVSLREGKVYVNGNQLDESYLPSNLLTPGGSFLSDGDQVIVPDGNLFVMGDNRTNSSDSRDWGFVPESEIIGRSFFVYWPFTKMRVVDHAEY